MLPTDNPEKLLHRLSDDLGLDYETQDWDIINADGSRVDEFVTYFKNVHLEPTQRFELAGLILASANEALISGMPVSLADILALANAAAPSFAHHVEYWLHLDDEGEFPLTVKLRETLGR